MPTRCNCGCGRRVAYSGMIRPSCRDRLQAKGYSVSSHNVGKEKVRLSQARKVARRKAARICLDCKTDLPHNHTTLRCNPCAGVMLSTLQKLRAKAFKEGRCQQCGVAPRRPGMIHCEDCSIVGRIGKKRNNSKVYQDTGEARALKKNRPLPTIPYFQQLDNKKEALRKILKKIDIPIEGVFLDTEVFENQTQSAKNTYEWTFYDPRKEDEDAWLYLRFDWKYHTSVPKATLATWALKVCNFLDDGDIIVQHGVSKPDWLRLLDLFTYLPNDVKAPELEVFDAQNKLFKAIQTLDSKEELTDSGKVYFQNLGLTHLAKRSIRTNGKSYAVKYDWLLTWRDQEEEGKSVVDVIYLYEMVRALNHIKEGRTLAQVLAV